MKISGANDCQYVVSHVDIKELGLRASEILACVSVWERGRKRDKENDRENEVFHYKMKRNLTKGVFKVLKEIPKTIQLRYL